MKKILYILIILFCGTVYAQENHLSDCKLQSENKTWKAEFNKAKTKAERIELIKKKIKSDSLYVKFEPKIKTAHSATITNEHVNKNGTECGCKILFILHYKKQKRIFLNLNDRPELSDVVKNLNTNNINKVTNTFDKTIARALYGINGKCGFIHLTTTDKKLQRLIKNVW